MRRKIALPLMVLFLCAACVTLTPSQRVLWAIRVYQAEYDSYLERTIDPNVTLEQKAKLKADPALITPKFINYDLTEDERKILRVKKQILIELKPLVVAAAEYQKTGVLPTEDIQRKMVELINRLVELDKEGK